MGTAIYAVNGYNGTVIADQTACTPANTGALQINNASGGIVKWVTDANYGGSYAIDCTNVAGQAASIRWPFLNPSQTVSEAFEWTCPALPADSANPLTIATLRDETNTAAKKVPVIVQLLNTGQFNVLAGISGVGTGQASLPAPKSPTNTTPAALVPGNRYIIEKSATCSTGVVGVRISNRGSAVGTYVGDATTAAGSPAAIGTFTFTHSDVGIGGYPTVRNMRVANVRMIDGSASYPGPYVATTPPFDVTAVFTPDEATGDTTASVTFTRNAGTGTGATMKVAMTSWGDGASTPATVAPNGTLTLTHLYSNPTAKTVYNWRADITLDA